MQARENVMAELFNQAGQLIKKSNLGKVDGNVVLPFNTSVLASGSLRSSDYSGNQNRKPEGN